MCELCKNRKNGKTKFVISKKHVQEDTQSFNEMAVIGKKLVRMSKELKADDKKLKKA